MSKEVINRFSPEKIKIGTKCMYGEILYVWDDPKRPFAKWVLIKNNSVHAPKDSFSFYLYRDDINGGDLRTFHFVPSCIIKQLSKMDPSDFEFSKQVNDDPYSAQDVSIKRPRKAKKDSVKELSSVTEQKEKTSVSVKDISPATEKKQKENIPIKESKENLQLLSKKKHSPKIEGKPFKDIFTMFN